MQRLMQPFDLTLAPLWRVWLVRRSNGDELVVLDIHHIIADGTAMTVIFREVSEILRGVPLSPPRLTMGDFAGWQQSAEPQTKAAGRRRFCIDEYGRLPTPPNVAYRTPPPSLA